MSSGWTWDAFSGALLIRVLPMCVVFCSGRGKRWGEGLAGRPIGWGLGGGRGGGEGVDCAKWPSPTLLLP